MRNLIGLCFLVSSLFVSSVHAQESYKTETIVGIGATLGKLADDSIQIIRLIPNSPAEHSGLAKDDFIIEVKSLPNSPVVDVRSLPLDDVAALIRGPAGVPVEISFVRGSSEPTVLSITRTVIEID
ncbi:MAG: PDZ domain-containing protein [Bdellovibrionaceae bacterium]|nr:PDZ domain-containing protein [Pseudobdellovibrionaceae bacterium]